MVTYAESDNVLHEERPGHIRLNILLLISLNLVQGVINKTKANLSAGHNIILQALFWVNNHSVTSVFILVKQRN